MRGMTQIERNEIRAELYQIICGTKSIKAIACVACIEAAYQMPSVICSDDLYHFTYKPISERFQYYLQDLSKSVGRAETGIIVADHRGVKADARFRRAHERLVRIGSDFTSQDDNLVQLELERVVVHAKARRSPTIEIRCVCLLPVLPAAARYFG
jgi:predicted DNA-binding ArsR family transcriptional regulator